MGEREADVIGADTNRLLKAREKVLPEDDLTIPVESRLLAKADRLAAERRDAAIVAASNRVVKPMERLYLRALKEGRTVDAEFYRKSIKSYYPTWEYRAPEASEK